jgi:hypothetical protein
MLTRVLSVGACVRDQIYIFNRVGKLVLQAHSDPLALLPATIQTAGST